MSRGRAALFLAHFGSCMQRWPKGTCVMYKLSLINPPHVPSLSGLCYVNVETLGLLNKINTSNYICVLARVAGIPKISVHTRLWKRARRTDELSARENLLYKPIGWTLEWTIGPLK